MKVCLLYEDREWAKEDKYYDPASIINDLGLKALFLAASKKIVYEKGEVKSLDKQDPYLSETLKNVMMTPLVSKEEIVFRQQIVRDCIENEDLIRGLYMTGYQNAHAYL